MDTEPYSSDKQKGKAISELVALVVQLQQQLEFEKINGESREKQPETCYAKISVT